MKKLTKITPEMIWDDWLGYCRTYLNRYGIVKETEVMAIAMNLWEVVKRCLDRQRKEDEEKWKNKFRSILQQGEGSGNWRRLINQHLSDFLEQDTTNW